MEEKYIQNFCVKQWCWINVVFGKEMSSGKRPVENDRYFVFQMDPMKYHCLVFKNKTIVGSYSTNDLKILFLPSHSGIFQCILNVASWPVSADAETIVQSEALASRVVLTAVAENPDLEVSSCLLQVFYCCCNFMNNLMTLDNSRIARLFLRETWNFICFKWEYKENFEKLIAVWGVPFVEKHLAGNEGFCMESFIHKLKCITFSLLKDWMRP